MEKESAQVRKFAPVRRQKQAWQPWRGRILRRRTHCSKGSGTLLRTDLLNLARRERTMGSKNSLRNFREMPSVGTMWIYQMPSEHNPERTSLRGTVSPGHGSRTTPLSYIQAAKAQAPIDCRWPRGTLKFSSCFHWKPFPRLCDIANLQTLRCPAPHSP